MLERYLLRYFLAVIDQGSFSRAAEQCRVSQPTLSVGIAKLEAMLGAPLFQRSRREVRPTAAGSRLVAHARRIESEFNQAQAAVHAADAPAIVRLGVLNSVAGHELARIVAQAMARAPGERFELVPGTARELAARLVRGRIEAALTLVGGSGDDRFVVRPLREEGFALALPATHRLAGRDAAAAEEVAEEVMIVRRHCESLPAVSRHFTERGIRPHFALRATNDERVCQMIAAGMGITVMPASYAAPGVAMVRLAGFEERRTLGLAIAPAAAGLMAAPPAIIAAAAAVMAAG